MSAWKDALLLRAAQAAVHWHGRLGPAQAFLKGAQYVPAQPPDENRQRVRVAAVQFLFRLFASATDYAHECYAWTRRAVEAGAQLIVFPEMVGFAPFLGLVPGIESQAAAISEPASDGGNLLAVVTGIVAPVATRTYRFVFQNLARRFGVHIAAGSAVVAASDGTLRNTAFLFGPDGAERGHQAKGHLFGMEFGMGLTRGGFIQVFDTPVGKLAMPVCMDHTYFETARIAYLLGAEILLDPAFDEIAEYNWWYQQRGVWGRVQESPAYGVHAMMVGDGLGHSFWGRSGIFAPVEMAGKDGVLALAVTSDQGEVVVADLDLAALREFRQNRALQPRYDWCARHLGKIWERVDT